MLKLGWFSTGRGPGSRNLLRTVMEEKKKYGLDIEIAFVFCNWDNTEEPNAKKEQREMFFDLVKSYDIPLITKSWKTFRPDLWDTDEKAWRDEYGKEIRRLTSEYNIDLGILAVENSVHRQHRCQQQAKDAQQNYQPHFFLLFGLFSRFHNIIFFHVSNLLRNLS